MAEETAKKGDREMLIELATGAKQFLSNADVDPVRDESLMRAAVAFHMLEREKLFVPMTDEFRRAHAVALIAINIDDHPPNTPQRAALFATELPDV